MTTSLLLDLRFLTRRARAKISENLKILRRNLCTKKRSEVLTERKAFCACATLVVACTILFRTEFSVSTRRHINALAVGLAAAKVRYERLVRAVASAPVSIRVTYGLIFFLTELSPPAARKFAFLARRATLT